VSSETSDLAETAAPLSDLPDGDASIAWAMVDASPDALVMTNEHGVIELVNRQTEVLFGYDRGELLGRPVESLLPERLGQVHRANRTRYRAKPEVRSMGTGMELSAIRRDGTEFPVEISLSPLQVGDDLRIIAAVRDITDRVDADAQDRAVRQGLNTVEDGIFMFEAEFLQFTYVNSGAVNQVGYSQAELLDMTPIHLKPEFTEAQFRTLIAPVLAGDIPSLHFSTVHRCKDGSDIPVEIVLHQPAGNESVTRQPLVALVRDITERLRHERELADSQRKSSLLEDRERIGRDMHDTVISRLFGVGMTLQGTISTVRDDAVRDRLDDAIDQIDETIKAIRATLYGSRASKDSGVGLSAQILAIVTEEHDALGLEPSVGLRGLIDEIPASASEALMATLREALTNAAKYAQATTVSVDVVVEQDEVRLVITDDGVGFPALDDAADIDATSMTGKGLRNIVTRALDLGGRATIKSSPNAGTTIEWTVPAS
jgi:PAS domain S-box-containing protein